MECNIYGRNGGGNPMLKAKLLSPEMVGVMRAAGQLAADLYSFGVVAVRSGALSRSARVDLALGGTKFDRICADVTVGQGTPRGGYGASHEHGIGIHPKSRVPPTPWMPQQPVDDLVKVLAIMDSLT